MRIDHFVQTHGGGTLRALALGNGSEPAERSAAALTHVFGSLLHGRRFHRGLLHLHGALLRAAHRVLLRDLLRLSLVLPLLPVLLGALLHHGGNLGPVRFLHVVRVALVPLGARRARADGERSGE